MAMLVATLVVSPLFPKSMSVAIIVIAYAGDLFTSYASSGNSLPTHLYAYGMLAYSTNVIIAAALFTYYVVATLLISPPGPGTNPVSMISMYAMVLLLGRALSWSEKTTRKRFEAVQNKNRLQELESRARIADAIHDAVTGDLSAAAFVAQRHVGGVSGSPSAAATSPVSAADAEDWRQINEYVLSALTNVHRVIDELNMDVTVLPGDADGEALANLLRTTMDDGDRRLRKLGFEITSIRHCAGGKPSASRETAELANNLLREIYANIARHAAPGSKVDLSVMLRPNAIEITQINPMKEEIAGADGHDNELPGGHGLASFKKQLESHQGALTTSAQDGSWTLFTYIPVTVIDDSPGLLEQVQA
nr:ATP-binding protein [Bifidobacterium catenulatum]